MVQSTANRVILNTIVQYTKTGINILITFFSTRIVLDVLGFDDYGIYSLVSGIILMLSFITNALSVSTQRFLSFYRGLEDNAKLKTIFCNCLWVHILLGIVIYFVLELFGTLLLDNFLNISNERIEATKTIFHILSISVLISFISSPFSALLIAHENILYVSIVSIINSILNLLIALIIRYSSNDKLIEYVMLLAAVNFVILLAFLIYDAITYKEFTLPRIDLFDWPLVKSIFTFASWNIYSTGCILGRNQGLSIVFNKFYGTIINASFGIALQINSVIQFMSTSLQNAINPQIMMSEGASNRERMLRLSEISSKFSFVLLSALGIPCIFEMDTLLVMWLKEVPPYAVFFCRMWILASIIDQLTIGLVSANQATGHLKVFSLIINTTKLLTLPISIVLLLYGFKIEHVMITFVIIEFLCTFMRIPIMAKTADLSIKKYFNRVILKNILPEIVLIISCFLICKLINVPYRFFITLFISVLFYGISVYYIGLCQDEKQVISKFLKGAFNKFYS